MKATETTSSHATASPRTSVPFFNKSGSGSFFGYEQTTEPFFSPKTVQPKLTIGSPNDVYEQQADAVADQVVAKLNAPNSKPETENSTSTPSVQKQNSNENEEESLQLKENDLEKTDNALQMKPIFDSLATPPPPSDEDTVQRKCADCDKEDPVQKKSEGNTEGSASADLSSRLSSSKGGGSPLSNDVRRSMESAIGADFSSVRVHTGSESVQMNRELNAQAFAHGNDVYFGAGKYNPSSASGQHLLAHELVHTVQQGTPNIQKFGAMEHRNLGHQGTKTATGQQQMVQLSVNYSLPFGDVVAMAGDLFESLDKMRQLAQNLGPGANSQEELEYAKIVKVHGHKDRENDFSEAAKTAVNSRYYRLALNNRSHFDNPERNDVNRSIQEKAAQWSSNLHEIPNSAAGYRRYHIQSVLEAYMAGAANQTIESALASEAFGAHYLTDSFSAGHVTTPRATINEHWNTLLPMFNFNLKGFMAQAIAEKLNDIEKKGYFLTVDGFYDFGFGLGSLNVITEKIDSKGFITFGDVVSGAIHDYYNVHGLRVRIQGREAQLFGDGHLDEGDERNYAVQAIRLGFDEVKMAFEMGKRQENMLDLFNFTRDSGLFAPEKLLPIPMAANELSPSEQPIKWDYDNVDGLLGDVKFGDALTLFCQEKASEFAEVAQELEDTQQQAFNEGIISKLTSQPINTIRQVINWTPNTGGGLFGHNQDDNALDYFNTASSTMTNGRNALGRLTLTQRIRLVRHLIDGYTGSDEEEAVVQIFQTAPPTDRTFIYQGVEGHAWRGDWIQGWFTNDDDIWNAHSRNQLTKIKNLINSNEV